MNNIINMFKKIWKYLLVALVVTIFLRYKFGPEFFDMFGLITFGGLVFTALWGLYTKKRIPDWALFSILITGLFGLIVDFWTSFNLIKSWIFRI